MEEAGGTPALLGQKIVAANNAKKVSVKNSRANNEARDSISKVSFPHASSGNLQETNTGHEKNKLRIKTVIKSGG